MAHRIFWLVILAALLSGCAQLPPSSVTLSDSIADDVASMQEAHKAVVDYYFEGLEQQANDLIDNKYRPSLIRQVIELDVKKFNSPDPNVRSQSLFNAIQEAFVDNKNLSPAELATVQSNAMAGMKIFYTKIDQKVESERNKLIDPLKQQRQQLLAAIDANYINIIKKNATITALLNSVVKVHESQQEVLSMAGIDEDLRAKFGGELANLSDKIEEIENKVSDETGRVEGYEDAINKFKKLFEKD